jgi:hypothetical protein
MTPVTSSGRVIPSEARDLLFPLPLAFALTLTLALGCGGDAVATTTAARGTQYIVGVDISSSRSAMDLRESQALLNGLVDRMTYGDKLVVVEMYGAAEPQQVADSIRPMKGATPSPRERRELDDFRARTRAILPLFFDSTRQKEVLVTDVFGTLFRAADYAKAPNHDRTILVLLSDMIQATGEANMEKESGIPGADWIESRAADQRLPDMKGICVVVSGAETKSARGAQIRKFWQDYFERVGARMPVERYRGLIADPGQLACS